jgi:protein required for attachment to host cells
MMRHDWSRLWILVINSTRARILRGLTTSGQSAAVELVMKGEVKNLREMFSERPGQETPSQDQRHLSRFERGSASVSKDRREFIGQVLAMLDSHRRAGEFDTLAIFADTEVLGLLRQMMPEALRALVICEVAKNLVHLSAESLPKVILEELDTGTHLD